MTSLIAILPLLLVCQLQVHGIEGSSRVAGALGTLGKVVERLSLPAGYVAHPDVGVAYKVHSGSVSVTWAQAKERCISEGANLAVIDSEKKLEYALQPPMGTGVRHVGIHQNSNFDWVSVANGAKVSNVPWKEGQPRLLTFSSDHCAMIEWKLPNISPRIISGRPEYHGDFVCEIPVSSATQ